MKAYIDKEEIYPFFTLDIPKEGDLPWGKQIELSEEFVAEYKEVIAKFWLIQEQLKALYE